MKDHAPTGFTVFVGNISASPEAQALFQWASLLSTRVKLAGLAGWASRGQPPVRAFRLVRTLQRTNFTTRSRKFNHLIRRALRSFENIRGGWITIWHANCTREAQMVSSR